MDKLAQLDSAKVEKDAPKAGSKWRRVNSYTFRIPKYYRFRVKAGFVLNSGEDQNFQVIQRTVQTPSNAAENVRIVENLGTETRENTRVIMLSLYLAGKNLRDNTSLFSTIFSKKTWDYDGKLWLRGGREGWKHTGRAFEAFVKHSTAVAIGLPFKTTLREVYVGGTFEMLKGVDLVVGRHSAVKQTLKGGIMEGVPYRDTEGPNTTTDLKGFLKMSREWQSYYGLTVDTRIFVRAFLGLF